MGFKIKVPKISSITKNPIGGALVGGLLGGPMGAQIGAGASLLNGMKKDDPLTLNEDPKLTALRSQMSGEAQKFRKDLPGLVEGEKRGLESTANQALERGTKQTRQNYNRRGLLYSGLRQGAEQTVKGNVASTLARQIADVNKQYQDLASSKENVAANVGLQGYGEALQRANQLYDSQQANSVARNQALQQFGSGIGYLAGSAYGSRPTADQTYGTPTQSTAYYNPNSSLRNVS